MMDKDNAFEQLLNWADLHARRSWMWKPVFWVAMTTVLPVYWFWDIVIVNDDREPLRRRLLAFAYGMWTLLLMGPLAPLYLLWLWLSRTFRRR